MALYRLGWDLYASVFDGTSWGSPTLLEGTAQVKAADVAIAASGNAMAVWAQVDGGVDSRSTLGSAGYNQVRVGVDGQGNAIVAWMQEDAAFSTITNIYAAELR